jgi:hypothetical protein
MGRLLRASPARRTVAARLTRHAGQTAACVHGWAGRHTPLAVEVSGDALKRARSERQDPLGWLAAAGH